MYVRHDVVTTPFLLFGGHAEINVVDVLLHFVELFVRNIQSQVLKQWSASL